MIRQNPPLLHKDVRKKASLHPPTRAAAMCTWERAWAQTDDARAGGRAGVGADAGVHAIL